MSRRPIGSRVLWGEARSAAQHLDAAMVQFYPDPTTYKGFDGKLDDSSLPQKKNFARWKRPKRKDGTRKRGTQVRPLVIREIRNAKDEKGRSVRGRFVSLADYEQRAAKYREDVKKYFEENKRRSRR